MSMPAPEQTPEAPPKRALRILHLDDMRELCDIVRVSLARDGHTVESFGDGASALRRLQEDPTAFDLFISDHHMPRMNGLEVVRHLRRISYPGKIFIYSSEIDEDVNNLYLDLKVTRVMPKPILLPELRQLLTDL